MSKAEVNKELCEGEYLPQDLDTNELSDTSHLKSHSMVFSAIDLSQKMQDMMALMFTRMKASDWSGPKGSAPEYTWTIDELSAWFGISKGQVAATLKVPAKALSNTSAGFKNDKGEFQYTPLLKNVKYYNGILSMVPNDMLKHHYLVNVDETRGFAKVDNKIFRSLTNPNSKRIFDFICRFKGEYDLYPMSVERMQHYLGVIDPTNDKPIKKSYAIETQFINKLIKPSLIQIAECPEIEGKLELIEKDGKVGYEISKMSNGKHKIKFNIKWLNEVTPQPLDKEQRLTVLQEVDEQMSLYKDVVRHSGNGLTHLEKIRDLLASIGESTVQVDEKIKLVIKEQEDKEKIEQFNLKSLEDKIFSGLLDL
ncbi:hypothetical protein VA249_45830 (plasmid) [Vibrio alfacsensis]|uniref:replication initiation protein n=1 Tax=Vibrio alfacsensis TaxID=1074311 RepID=UPI001BF06B0A|nr:replication initiation protein [Vibrio alfacsensis]BBM67937.1 hypothetical protein VA249_45830 [Vibrio alfacsensis]